MDPKKTSIVAAAFALFYNATSFADSPGQYRPPQRQYGDQVQQQPPNPNDAYAAEPNDPQGFGYGAEEGAYDPRAVGGPPPPPPVVAGPGPAYVEPVGPAPYPAPPGPPCEAFGNGGVYFGQPFPPYCGPRAGLVAAVPLDGAPGVGPYGADACGAYEDPSGAYFGAMIPDNCGQYAGLLPVVPDAYGFVAAYGSYPGFYVNTVPFVINGRNFYRPYSNGFVRRGQNFNYFRPGAGFGGGVARGPGFAGGGRVTYNANQFRSGGAPMTGFRGPQMRPNMAPPMQMRRPSMGGGMQMGGRMPMMRGPRR